MRTKEKILENYEDDINYTNETEPQATQGHIFLEVLIDIRDTFRIASNNMEALLEKLAREGK